MSTAAPGGLRVLGLVIGRELTEAFRRKTVWVTAAVFLLASSALMVLPELIGGDSGSDDRRVMVLGHTPTPFDDLVSSVAASDGLHLELVVAGTVGEFETAIDARGVHAGVRFDGGTPVVVVTDADDSRLLGALRQAIGAATVVERLRGAGLDPAAIAEITAPAEPAIEIRDTERGGRQAVALVASIVTYIVLLLVMTTVANGVAIEKSNRVSEVLLAIVSPRALLFGKVIGVGILGLFTLVSGAIPVMIRLALGGSVPPGTGWTLAATAAFFVLGMALYLTLAGALGALVGRTEEVGAAVGPLSVILIGGYVIGQAAAGTMVGSVLGYLPLTSPVVMPARIALGESSLVEVVISLLLGVIAVVIAVRAATVVYRRAIVRTGERLHLRDVIGRRAAAEHPAHPPDRSQMIFPPT